MAEGKSQKADTREAAKAVEDAQAELLAAQERAAEAGQGLAAARMQNVPEMEVEVVEGSLISHNDKAYYGEGYPLAPDDHKGNDTLKLDGPTALALMQSGHVRIKGAA